MSANKSGTLNIRKPYSQERFFSLVNGLLVDGMSRANVENAFNKWFGIELNLSDDQLTIDEIDIVTVERRFDEIVARFERFKESGLSYVDYCKREEILELRPPSTARQKDLKNNVSRKPIGLIVGITAVILFSGLLVYFASLDSASHDNSDSKATPVKEKSFGEPGMVKPVEEMTLQELDALREDNIRRVGDRKGVVDSLRKAADSRFTEREQEVFRYINEQFTAMDQASTSGYDGDKHDEEVFSAAAAHFGISKQEAEDIFQRINMAEAKAVVP